MHNSHTKHLLAALIAGILVSGNIASAASVTGLSAGTYVYEEYDSDNDQFVSTNINLAGVTSLNVTSLVYADPMTCLIELGTNGLTEQTGFYFSDEGTPFTHPSGELRYYRTNDAQVGIQLRPGIITNDFSMTFSDDPDYGHLFNGAPPPDVIVNITMEELSGFADFEACFPNATITPGSSSSSSSTATSTTTAVTSDVFTRTASTVSGNTRMMDMALTRFIGENRTSADDSGMGPLAFYVGRDSVTGPLGLQINGFNLDADDDGGFLFSSASYMDVSNGWRRVGFAELSFQDTQGVGSTLSVNGRISQERYLTATTLYGYFLGAELHRSDIEGSFAGDQNSWGVLAGAYTVTEAENGMIGSAYAALGFNRSDLNVGDGTTTVSDNYDTRSVMVGAKLSGDLDYTSYRLRPSVAANYAATDIGTLNMTETTGGVDAPLSVAVGTVRFMEIVASPEFVFDVDPIGTGFGATELSVAPRLTCERRDAATDTRNCGGGLALGLTSNSSDGMTTLNGGVSFDRIGGQDRRTLQLQAEMRF